MFSLAYCSAPSVNIFARYPRALQSVCFAHIVGLLRDRCFVVSEHEIWFIFIWNFSRAFLAFAFYHLILFNFSFYWCRLCARFLAPSSAFLAALLFAVQPIHTEAVSLQVISSQFSKMFFLRLARYRPIICRVGSTTGMSSWLDRIFLFYFIF